MAQSDDRVPRLFRSMTVDRDGRPATGPSARMLGVRPDVDVLVDAHGRVRPGTGGMSVSTEDPLNLPHNRLPPTFGGMGKDPVWSIPVRDLCTDMTYRPDPTNPPRHGFVEPFRTMSFGEFQRAVRATTARWRHHNPDSVDWSDGNLTG
jgi:hypothetical protein